MSKGQKFDEVKQGIFDASGAECLRFSTAVRALRKQGLEDSAKALERDQLAFGSTCPTHGPLADPVIGYVGSGSGARVAFGCPWCSDPKVLAAWEKEGMRS